MGQVTAKQIAEKLGISPTAVSLALHGKPGVSEATRSAVAEMAQRLGYKPPHTSNVPLRATTKALCFMIFAGQTSQHSPFSTFVLEGIEKTAAMEGYHVLIRYLYADHILDTTNVSLLQQVDGLILLGTDIAENHCSQILSLFQAAGNRPTVILDSTMLAGQMDCISNDNYGGVCLAAAHLIEQGCNQLGYFRSTLRVSAFKERERGLRDTIASAGLTAPVVVPVGISYDESYRDISTWLDTDPILPDGFFAENDVVAAAAISAMKAKGIQVPQQVSVVGFDDVPIAQMTEPQITSIKSFTEELGAAAANTVFQRLRLAEFGVLPKAFLQTYVSTQLQERDSVRKPATL